jgi:hypothetical protein
MNRPSLQNRLGAPWLRFAIFVWVSVAGSAAYGADALPMLHVDASRTSVSGLSSGAFMTVQYGVAFSSSVIGLGVVAGGPYNCAYVNLGGVEACMSGAPSGGMSWAGAQGFASLGQIDPVAGLSRLKVYVFGGTKDQVVLPPVVKATHDFFKAAGVPSRNLAFIDKMPAGHAFIAPAFGNACATNGAPYIDHCPAKKAVAQAYDQPFAILTWIYGPLKPFAIRSTRVRRPRKQPGLCWLRLHPERVRGASFPVCRARCPPWLQAGRAERRQRRLCLGWLQPLGRLQPIGRAVSAGRDQRNQSRQSGGLLGLVGLYRPRFPDPRRPADGGDQGDGRSAHRPEVSVRETAGLPRQRCSCVASPRSEDHASGSDRVRCRSDRARRCAGERFRGRGSGSRRATKRKPGRCPERPAPLASRRSRERPRRCQPPRRRHPPA